MSSKLSRTTLVALVALGALVVIALLLGGSWGVLFYLIFGLVIGMIARVLIPGRQHMNMMMTAVLGAIGTIAGAILSHYAAPHVDFLGGSFQYIPGLLLAIVLIAVVGGWNDDEQDVA